MLEEMTLRHSLIHMYGSHLNGGEKINLQSYYRQWQEMNENSHIPDTASPAAQRMRFSEISFGNE